MSATKLVLQDFDDVTYDPFEIQEHAFGDTKDPYAVIAEKQKQNWIHPVEYRNWFTDVEDQALGKFPHYTVLGYGKVEQILMNPAAFTNEINKHSLGRSFGRTVTAMDAPEHPRYRRIFQKAFMPHVVRTWGENIVQPVVDNLLDAFRNDGKADIYGQFAKHYPFHIIYKQLDLPPEDVNLFHKLAITQTLHTVDLPKAIEAGEKLGVYFDDLLKQRRENPGEDIISLLGQAEVEGERLPDEVVVSFLRQLINAGGDTTYRGTSALLTGLLTNPEQLAAVKEDRTLVAPAIEEALRWEGPVIAIRRWVKEDIEIEGELMKGASAVDVVLGSANRDPSKFEKPNVFNIFRKREARSFPFGAGAHVCIGQHLAKVEMERALNTFLDELKNVRLDPDYPPPHLRGFTMRVPDQIRVVFDT